MGMLLLWMLILFSVVGASVWYDERAIVINGERRMLFSGSIHYPRSTPNMWPQLIRNAKEGGLDVIQTYVFWNGHEPSPGQYYFEDQYDLVRFIRIVKEAGLYVHLRIGPYICAEWNFGGFPVWLKRIPGISFRENNGPFKKHMHRFVKFIVDKMKEERLFEPQGGPIILCQIENELGPVEYEVGASAREYGKWAAHMALGLWTDVPWVMCKEEDAPYPIIDTCNGFYCEGFRPNNRSKPMMWTEAWTGWYTGFGKPIVERSAQDLAYAVALSIMNGMAFVNYYMYHGGTNFGRTAGGPFIATSYDYDAPLDEYGLKKQPKWGHLKQLHRAVKLCEPMLLAGSPTQIYLGDHQEARVFSSPSGACAAFLANHDTKKYAKVSFRSKFHDLPPWSVSILPDCENIAFNTAMVGTQTAVMKMTPVAKGLSWMSYGEETASCDGSGYTTAWMLEQINMTRDQSDYLWYMTEVSIDPGESFLSSGKWPILTVESSGHGAHVFINGVLSGTGYGSVDNPKFTFTKEVELKAGTNKISMLSMAVGLPNVGSHFEWWKVGVLGPVSLNGVEGGKRELTWQNWCYKIGLHGENLELNSLTGSSSVEWNEHDFGPLSYRPLMWYKASFDVPVGVEPLALDMGAMSKGRLWVNGRDLGRHWPSYTAQGHCVDCNYTGMFSEHSCLKYCNLPSQRWYHLPREWVYPRGNLLVVFEELGGDPRWITVVKKEISSVCAQVDEFQPTIQSWRSQKNNKSTTPLWPKVHLSCSPGAKIQSIRFASFGTPSGECGGFIEGSCHSRRSYDIFQRICVGARSCMVRISPENFGDPCPSRSKKLSVEAICG